MILTDLGARIRLRREKQGLRQHDIAHALQVSPQAVSKWERGENAPDIAILPALARLLSVSIDWMLGRDDERLDVFEATVFVSSIQGAFERSLGMDSRNFASWANGIFFQLTEAALRRDGVPIKYMGDAFLCFFSGSNHQKRAVDAARLSRSMIDEKLKIGLSCGDVYLGSVGHPEYAQPDIMGVVVNAAFLTMEWAESHASSGIAATDSVVKGQRLIVSGKGEKVTFKGIEQPVTVYALTPGKKDSA